MVFHLPLGIEEEGGHSLLPHCCTGDTYYNNNIIPSVIPQVGSEDGHVYAAFSLPCEGRETPTAYK